MLQEIQQTLDEANRAQQVWARQLLRKRLTAVGRVASLIAEHYDDLVGAIERPNASKSEKLASEVMPLADACRFTARTGRQVLAPKSMSMFNGAWWMGRLAIRQHAEPWGTVLILAPSNYPLLLPGVQVIQAVAAGNSVIVKPAPECEQVMHRLVDLLIDADIPQGVVQVVGTSIELAQGYLQQGVDKVVLTGSVHTGRAVLRQLAETLTPATVELSGCDAVLVLPQAKLDEVVDCLSYGLRLNGGATCIAPRRIFATPSHNRIAKALKEKLLANGESAARVPQRILGQVQRCVQEALDAGAKLVSGRIPRDGDSSMRPIVLDEVTPEMEIARSDIFAPVSSVIRVESVEDALKADRKCPYGLGMSIFGPRSYAEHWAEQIDAGCVVINDIIVPTADPRVTFGGRDQSGWGSTRGRTGLLEMTRPKAVCVRKGSWRPHLDKRNADNAEMLACLLRIFHARGLKSRFAAMQKLAGMVMDQRRADQEKAKKQD
ncbi:MAG TPA: aldehyde dehydrogenase [Planctomycetaceae bacterium]|nr:aldehyde dehydrogenase [Planctomycetaceae bacterium]